jgi:hypothetical protein
VATELPRSGLVQLVITVPGWGAVPRIADYTANDLFLSGGEALKVSQKLFHNVHWGGSEDSPKSWNGSASIGHVPDSALKMPCWDRAKLLDRGHHGVYG